MPQITLSDLSLKNYVLTPRVSYLKEIYFRAKPEICTERAGLITHFHLDNGLFEQGRISILDKAKAYRHVLEKRTPIVRHTRGRSEERRVGKEGRSRWSPY